MKISLNFSALDAIEDLFGEMKLRVTDFSDIGDNLADIMRDDVRKRLISAPMTEVGGMAYGGVYWDRLTDASFAFNPNRRGKKIGTETGTLMRQSTAKGGENLYSINGTNFVFELTSTRAADFTAYRPLVYWHPELLQRISTEITDFIVEVANG